MAEDDDVAAIHRVVEPIDDDAIADLEGLLHRLRRHPEGLDEEGLDQGDSGQRQEDFDDERQPAAFARSRGVVSIAGRWVDLGVRRHDRQA